MELLMAETTEVRLGRIEDKLDKLADAMVSLARAEEKMIALKEDQDHMYDRVNRPVSYTHLTLPTKA